LLTTSWIEFTEGFRCFDFKSFIIWKYAGSFDSSYCRFHNDYEVIYHLSKGDNITLNIDKDEKRVEDIFNENQTKTRKVKRQ